MDITSIVLVVGIIILAVILVEIVIHLGEDDSEKGED